MAAGRPRLFCKNQALDRAMDVFWRKGFEGASICDLTEAMGVNPPSLYAAFGNKESLFAQALDRYAETNGAAIRETLDTPRARDGIAALLQKTAQALTDKAKPSGCLFVQGVSGAGEHAERIRDMLSAKRAACEKDMADRLKRAKKDGELPEGTDASALARFYATVTQGMAVQASGGASRRDLERVAETALAAWPD